MVTCLSTCHHWFFVIICFDLVFVFVIIVSVAHDCVEPSEGLACFSQRFAQRYGSIHPLFYIGSLADAVSEATGGSVAKVRVRERKREKEGERIDNIKRVK